MATDRRLLQSSDCQHFAQGLVAQQVGDHGGRLPGGTIEQVASGLASVVWTVRPSGISSFPMSRWGASWSM